MEATIKNVGAECRYKNSMITGRIKQEDSTHFGIYWYGAMEGNIHARRASGNIRNKRLHTFLDRFRKTKRTTSGTPYYWNDKANIVILSK